MRPASKSQGLALLGYVGFNDANASKRFGETSGKRRRNFSPLTEQRPQPRESESQRATKYAQYEDGNRSQTPVKPEQNANRYNGSDETADQLHQTRAYQITDALSIVHDP